VSADRCAPWRATKSSDIPRRGPHWGFTLSLWYFPEGNLLVFADRCAPWRGTKIIQKMVKRSLTWAEVWRRRLGRHVLLVAAKRAPLAEVASDVCGIHAQVMTSAELSLGLRVQNITRHDVGAALWTEKTLLKTYGVRGTLRPGRAPNARNGTYR
jgi:hypothetical protein